MVLLLYLITDNLCMDVNKLTEKYAISPLYTYPAVQGSRFGDPVFLY
jgi:hypothetical protein